jgi:hypothetical protein
MSPEHKKHPSCSQFEPISRLLPLLKMGWNFSLIYAPAQVRENRKPAHWPMVYAPTYGGRPTYGGGPLAVGGPHIVGILRYGERLEVVSG